MKHVLLLTAAIGLLCDPLFAAETGADKPNILWISSEDHGQEMGCYGDAYATTPNVDKLAAKGMLFKTVWSCAPVCAPCRTTIISGMYPPSTGAEHMRCEVPMPAGTRMFPQFLRKIGYYCSNNSKEDYNLTQPGRVWDESSPKAHWRNRPVGQPFFAVFNSTVSHESQLRKRPHKAIHDPAGVRVPSYHPDIPEVRQDWAQYYDTVTAADAIAGKHLKALEEAGLTDNTIVFYWGDHGSGMPRSKRWPCDSGLRVPLVVYFPEKWRHLAPKEYAPGAKSDRLVSFVDFAPTMLSLTGIQPPAWMQGHAFAGKFQTAPQPLLYGFRGRMDECTDAVRSVTDGRYVYLRNYMPHRSQGQHVIFQFETPTTQRWWDLFVQGKTTEAQSIFWRTPKASEELYDLQRDPDEVHNLAKSPEHAEILKKLRTAQQGLMKKIYDVGLLTEAEVNERAGPDAPYDMGHDATRYNFDHIFTAAELATRMQPETLPVLKEYLSDADSGVRYWGAAGILMQGQSAVEASKKELEKALSDSAVSVRIASAEALGRYGDTADLERALATLQAAADPTRTSATAALLAMTAIDALEMKAAPLKAFIQSMPTRDPKAKARPNSYVGRLQRTILARFSVKGVLLSTLLANKTQIEVGEGETGYVPFSMLKPELIPTPTTGVTANDLALPSTLYLTDQKVDLFFAPTVKNFFKNDKFVRLGMTNAKIHRHFMKLATLTPTNNGVATFTLYDDSFQSVVEKKVNTIITPQAKTGALNTIFVGSSITGGGYYIEYIKQLCGDGITFNGIRHCSLTGVHHEGRGGFGLGTYFQVIKSVGTAYVPFYHPTTGRYWGVTGYWADVMSAPEWGGKGTYAYDQNGFKTAALAAGFLSTGYIAGPKLLVNDIMYDTKLSSFVQWNGVDWVQIAQPATWECNLVKYGAMWDIVVPDVIFLAELGTNDFRGSTTDPDFTKWNSYVEQFLVALKAWNANAKLAVTISFSTL